jgi:hypothetical protein
MRREASRATPGRGKIGAILADMQEGKVIFTADQIRFVPERPSFCARSARFHRVQSPPYSRFSTVRGSLGPALTLRSSCVSGSNLPTSKSAHLFWHLFLHPFGHLFGHLGMGHFQPHFGHFSSCSTNVSAPRYKRRARRIFRTSSSSRGDVGVGAKGGEARVGCAPASCPAAVAAGSGGRENRRPLGRLGDREALYR